MEELIKEDTIGIVWDIVLRGVKNGTIINVKAAYNNRKSYYTYFMADGANQEATALWISRVIKSALQYST